MTTLLPFQYEGARSIHRFGGVALLADEMGLGKTLQALYYCWKMKRLRPVVVVCPASLKINWMREAMQHLGLASEILHGRKPAKNPWREHAPILIVNYDILAWWKDYLVGLSPQVIIWDEAHYIQSREAKRYKALKALIEEARIPHRIAISGTPLTNRPKELWTTLHLLHPEVFPSFITFGFEYCKPCLIRGRWEFEGARNLNKLHALLGELCMIRRLKKDVAQQLPAKVRRVIPLELEGPAWKEYCYASEHFIAWIRRTHPARLHKVKKAPHLARIGYLLRLTQKLKRFMVREWIENFHASSDEKLMVFSTSTKVLHWLQVQFPDSVIINGEVTGQHRQHAVDLFNRSPRVRNAFCDPKAAGVGLNMVSSSNVLYYDFPWAPGTVKQGEDRVHRLGQTKTCTTWFLPVRGTVEEKLCDLLHSKQGILDEVLDGKEVSTDFDIFQELLRATKPGLLS